MRNRVHFQTKYINFKNKIYKKIYTYTLLKNIVEKVWIELVSSKLYKTAGFCEKKVIIPYYTIKVKPVRFYNLIG